MIFFIKTFRFIIISILLLSQLGATPSEQKKQPFTSKLGIEFIPIPGGCFQMGSDFLKDFEHPVHDVCVDDFYIGKYEVTQKQWNQIMDSNPSKFIGENNPVDTDDDLNDYVAEGVEALVPYKGSVTDILVQITGGIRSGLSYCGGHTIPQMQTNSEFIKMSRAGFAESQPHDVDVV